jgi:hypothetical protein
LAANNDRNGVPSARGIPNGIREEIVNRLARFDPSLRAAQFALSAAQAKAAKRDVA